MSGAEKAGVLTKVASSGLPKRRVLGALGVPKSTYYRWLRQKEGQRLEDNAGGGNLPWNKLASQEVDSILSAARGMPAVGRMDHRQHGLLRIGVYGLPHPSEGGSGEEA